MQPGMLIRVPDAHEWVNELAQVVWVHDDFVGAVSTNHPSIRYQMSRKYLHYDPALGDWEWGLE